MEPTSRRQFLKRSGAAAAVTAAAVAVPSAVGADASPTEEESVKLPYGPTDDVEVYTTSRKVHAGRIVETSERFLTLETSWRDRVVIPWTAIESIQPYSGHS